MAILDSFGFGDPWHCLFSLFLFKGKKDLSALVCYLDPADAVDLCVQKAMADFAFGRHSVGFLYFLFRNPGKKSTMQSTLDQLDAFGAETTDASDADDADNATVSDDAETPDNTDDASETADNGTADAETAEAPADAPLEENSDPDKE